MTNELHDENAKESPGSDDTKRSVSIESEFDSDFLYLPPPKKSPADSKSYSVIKLTNGLIATIIADVIDSEFEVPGSECGSESLLLTRELGGLKRKSPSPVRPAACSLTIEVGSFSDPDDIQGLAHFLEHMVFMGSQKYPVENEFDSFVTRCGGYTNASTDSELTTFYFEVQEPHLKKALDIFSHFFKSPLMSKDAMARERNAIDSEFQHALPYDSERRQMVLCQTAHEDNPLRKFPWGNNKTLMDDVTDDYLYNSVHQFRKKHYTANRMKLAIQACLPEQTLISWVTRFFSGIQTNDEPRPEFILSSPFTSDFNKLFYIETIRDSCYLEITWSLPSDFQYYKCKPLHYLSFVLGHEGKGSLLSYLKKKLLALGLDAGQTSYTFFSLFTVTISLTRTGRENVTQVLTAVFNYLKMLIDTGPLIRLFKELQTISDTNFTYEEEDSAAVNVQFTSENMVYYPSVHYLIGSELYFEYDPDVIMDFMEQLTPMNANITLSARTICKHLPNVKVEPWFNTRYTFVYIPDSLVDNWHDRNIFPEFHMPLPNEFITTDFGLISRSKHIPKYPVKYKSSEIVDIWYKQDDKFLLPDAFIGIQIITNKCKLSVLDRMLALFYISLLQEFLNEELFPAQMALLDCTIYLTNNGIVFEVYGFKQKLKLILDKVAEQVLKFMDKVNDDVFAAIKEVMIRKSYNRNLDPETVAMDLGMSALVEKYFTSVEEYKAVKIASLDLVKKFATNLYKDVHAQCLVQGNITKEEAINVCEDFVRKLNCTNLKPAGFPKFKVYELPAGQKCIRTSSFNPNDKNCITTNYYQFGPGTIKEFVTLEVLLFLMSEPLFDKLRTQEQLGYDVSCSIVQTHGVIGFYITVSSQIDKHTVDHVQFRMVDFLHVFRLQLKCLSNRDFLEAAETVTYSKLVDDFTLGDEASRNWEEIKYFEYVFDRIDKEVKYITSLKLKNLANLIKKYMYVEKKLTVQVVGFKPLKGKAALCRQKELSAKKFLHYDFVKRHPRIQLQDYFITDISDFKKTLTAFPYSKLDH